MGKSSSPAHRKPLSIFLAEDNPADAALVREALELRGVEGELMLVADGEGAIKLLQALNADPSMDCPALAIIDLNLPKKSGCEVLEYLRRGGRCCDLPVMILSSSDAERDRADAARLGATRYVRKPIRLDEFLALGAVFEAALTAAQG